MPRVPRLSYLYPSAMAWMIWTFTAGLFSAAGRFRIAMLGYGVPWLRSPLPEIPSSEIIGAVSRLTIYEAEEVNGNTSLTEQIVLIRLAETLQPKTLFEFGTFDGRTALNLIAHSPPDAHLYTLDLPAGKIDATELPLETTDRPYIDKPQSGARFLGSEYAPRITQLYGDSASFDFSPYFGAIDMVFIDASHAYEYVKSDTLNAIKLLRPTGGLIVWHDYTLMWRGVIRALDEFYRSDRRFPGLRRVEGTTLVILRVG